MDVSTNVEKKKQRPQKPPLDFARIACEILAGTGAGLAVVLPVIYFLVARSGGDCFGVGKLLAAAAGFVIVPPLYAFAATFGIYLIGGRGNQTGSLPATLSGGLVGVPATIFLYIDGDMAGDMMFGIAKIVLWSFVFLAIPIMATLGFNLTRRYKEPLST